MDLVSNSFCSGSNVLGNGSWINVGGNARVTAGGVGIPQGGANPYGSADGGKAVRMFTPCGDASDCAWTDDVGAMPISRWYPTVETLEDGTALIIGGGAFSALSSALGRLTTPPSELYGSFVNTPQGGQNVPSAEYWPSRGEPFTVRLLEETMPVNLYPLTWLLSDGRLFMQVGQFLSRLSHFLEPL